MVEELWTTEAAVELDRVRLEVGTFRWPHPVETRICLDRHQFSFSLSQRPPRSEVSYQLAGTLRQFSDIGDMVFFPAKVPFVGRSEGGPQRLLICSMKDDEILSGQKPDSEWGAEELTAGLDLKNADMRNSLVRLAQEVLNPGLESKALLPALLTTLKVDLTRSLDMRGVSEDGCKGGLAPWQLRRVKQRVYECSNQNPSIEELATLCGISSRHLMRAFKKSCGTTLHKFVEETRIDRAKNLLVKTDLPMKTITWQLGFNHSSSFSAAFRRAIGIRPSEFRAQYRNLQA